MERAGDGEADSGAEDQAVDAGLRKRLPELKGMARNCEHQQSGVTGSERRGPLEIRGNIRSTTGNSPQTFFSNLN